jgi:outer membrane protein OmpA-like peptidoglycan-associated protein
MRRSLPLSLCLIGLFGISVAPSWSQNWGYMDKISAHQKAYWDNIHIGNIQKTGNVQKAGDLQKVNPSFEQLKEWGVKPATVKTEGCQHHLVLASDTLFNFNESTLTPEAASFLKAIGPDIKEMSATHPVVIEGHTDSIGTDDYNQGLSERRAEQVKNWLLSNHYVRPDAETKGYGKRRPVAENTLPNGKDNPKGRALNRRVELVVDGCKTASESTGGSTWSMTMAGPDQQTAKAQPDPNSEEAAKNAKYLPTADLYSSDEIHKSFNLIRATPLGNADLHLELLIPTDWVEQKITLTADEVARDRQRQIALLTMSPPKQDQVVTEVRYQKLPATISAEDFLKLYVEKSGMEFVARQHGNFNGKSAEDALVRMHSPDGNMFTRLTVARRGDYIFMLANSSPEEQYDQWKRIFGAAAVSFDPAGNAPVGAPAGSAPAASAASSSSPTAAADQTASNNVKK